MLPIRKPLIFVITSLLLVLFCNAQNYDSKSTIPVLEQTGQQKNGIKKELHHTSLQNVIIVYKTHFDIGYSQTVEQVVHDYRTAMADMVIDAIDKNSSQPKNKQFVWTVSGWPMKQILWDGQKPARKEKIETAIEHGNLVVHAMPFSMHVESSEPEDMVRGLNFSSTLARKYKQPLSISAKMSDAPSYSWFIPTLLTNAGVKFYHMGGPQVNKEYGLPPFFWWQGPDGSKLLTMYNNGYGSAELPPKNWPYKTWLHINMTGDNQGPPAPETIAKDLAYYSALGINAKVGSMDDFAEMILKEDLSNLPVVHSDMGDVWIHGTMSMPEATKLAQNIRPSIAGMDELSTLENIWGIYGPDLRKITAEAYEKSQLYSEHTWGMANQHYVKTPYGADWNKLWAQGLPPQFKLLQKSWNDKGAYINRVRDLVTDPYLDAVASLADNIKIDGNRIVVYNPLPWKRNGEVVLDSRLLFGSDFVSLKPVDGGPAITVSHEYPAIEDAAPMSRFVVTDIPSMGYRTFIVATEKVASPIMNADANTGVIESPFFKATLDAKRGSIISLINKKTGKEMVDANAPQGFGQYFYERFGYKQLSDWIDKSLYPEYIAHRFAFVAYDMPKDVPYSAALAQNMTLTIEKSAIDVKAIMTTVMPGPGLPQKIAITLTLSGFNATADMEVNWQKQPDSWPEAAWICLPFKFDHPKFRLGRLGADIDPVKDMTIDNANFHLSWINTGVAVYDGNTGAGAGICSPDAPLVSLGEPGEYQFDKRYEPKNPYVYINLYNNHWRTNFPAWIGNGERMSARVRIWAFDKFESESALYTPAMETRVPLQVSSSKVKNGQLPVTQPGITLSRKGVNVTAFGPNPDGDGTLLRVWEQGGITGNLLVTLPKGATFTEAQPVNLRGEKIGIVLNIVNGILSFELRAYAPVSFILKKVSDSKVQDLTGGAQFIKTLKSGKKITIVTMGTSLTGGTWRWPDMMMNDWLNITYPAQVTCFNEGVGASASSVGPGNNTLISGVGKLPAIMEHHPDVVFIEFATNDAFLPYNISLQQAKQNLNFFIDHIRIANPETEIILQTMNPVLDKDGVDASATKRPMLAEYNKIYRDVAKVCGLLLVDNYQNWNRLLQNNPVHFNELVPDGVHPHLEGYKEIVLPELKKVLDPEKE